MTWQESNTQHSISTHIAEADRLPGKKYGQYGSVDNGTDGKKGKASCSQTYIEEEEEETGRIIDPMHKNGLGRHSEDFYQ